MENTLAAIATEWAEAYGTEAAEWIKSAALCHERKLYKAANMADQFAKDAAYKAASYANFVLSINET